jgi:hypothetical protein
MDSFGAAVASPLSEMDAGRLENTNAFQQHVS